MHRLARLDQQHVWHPFTQMRDWLKRPPIVITSGKGAVLRDVHGRAYLDANASIWTNLHGHRHPAINAAVKRQLGKIAHSSALGLANEPAALLARELVEAAALPTLSIEHRTSNIELRTPNSGPPSSIPYPLSPIPYRPSPPLTKVFFSDDGSTAVEVALKLAYEFARRTGRSRKPRFLSLQGAYHGDTVGAVSLGHIDLFHRAYRDLLFKSDTVMAPYCYRCPFNKARLERADARAYRQCGFECADEVERAFARQIRRGNPYAAFVIEPLIQGAAGMIPQPAGWLRRVAEITRAHGALLIADEIMTGFGRTGSPSTFNVQRSTLNVQLPTINYQPSTLDLQPPTLNPQLSTPLLACHHEGVQPDFLCLAKGLTGGYLPMAATLTTHEVFDAFLGDYDEFKTFFHGHSYTANQLGAAAALASLKLLQAPDSRRARRRLEQDLRDGLESLWDLPHIGDIRQVGLVAGIELVRDWRTREPLDLRQRSGIRVCEEMARLGVLTRPVGNVIVLMPPYCTTPRQVTQIVDALRAGIRRALGTAKRP